MRHWMARGLKFVIVAGIAVLVFGYAVMLLWNWLLPAIAAWPTINFAQALGLLVLARLLFGGLRGHMGGHWRYRMHERWARMTPEEREKFRAGMHHHCHHRQGPQTPAT